jgi:hypothetical protein
VIPVPALVDILVVVRYVGGDAACHGAASTSACCSVRNREAVSPHALVQPAEDGILSHACCSTLLRSSQMGPLVLDNGAWG